MPRDQEPAPETLSAPAEAGANPASEPVGAAAVSIGVDLLAELRDALADAPDRPAAAVAEVIGAAGWLPPERAAGLWCDAADARLRAGDAARGGTDLLRAIELDPECPRALTAARDALPAAGRPAEGIALLEASLARLETPLPDDAGRRRELARRHEELGALWERALGRVDRALHHWQRAWELDPGATEAIDAARGLLARLGADSARAALLEAELARLGEDAPARRARLHHELAALLAQGSDAAAAAAHLEQAIALEPTDKRKELLAQICTGVPGTEQTAVAVLLELAAARQAAGDAEGAVTFLRRAQGVDPDDPNVVPALEAALAALGRWPEVDALLAMRASAAASEADAEALELRRAALRVERLGDREGGKRAYEAMAARQLPGGEALRHLRELYVADAEWAKVAALDERALAAAGELPAGDRIARLLELATVARERLSDRERAAGYLHQALGLDPTHPEVLARYAEHFREKRDWRGLAELEEFGAEAAREAGAPLEDYVRRLEELAHTCEARLGDVERATATWRRVVELDPEHARAREALRRLESRAKMWVSLIAVLEKEAEAAPGPRERADALKRIAQVYRERQVDPRRAIALYVEALELQPGDPAALKALGELYEREGDDAGVARTLRAQLEAEVDKLATAGPDGAPHRPPAAQWPQAMRAERLTGLRRLAALVERLGDVEGVLWACNAILELMPADRDTMDRLERVLERAGDGQRLEQAVQYRAQAAGGPAERGRALRRLAHLAEARGDGAAALERWEQVLRASPNDPEALEALSRLYEEVERWPELALVLERRVLARRPSDPVDPVTHGAELRRYAHVVDDRLRDVHRAVKAWARVLEAQPRDRGALEALARLFEAQGQWRELSEVLGRQVALAAIDDRPRAADLALARARLLEERLGAPREAAAALEALLAEVDPAHLEAHRTLRRLALAAGDADRAVRVAERELWLAGDDAEKIAVALEIGALCRDRLRDPRRALQAYERILAIEPDHAGALAAAAALHAVVGDWRRHVGALERLAALAPEIGGPEGRQALFGRIAGVVEERLGDPAAAFAWRRDAHALAPGDETLDELRSAAARHALWRDLAEVLEEERARALAGDDGPRRAVALGRELAALAETQLGDVLRALAALHEAVRLAPDDESLLAEAERVATDAGTPAAWDAVLETLDLVLGTRADDGARIALHERRARILDEHLAQPGRALDELLRAFALSYAVPSVREGILRLAERTGRWEHAVTVETTLYARETAPEARVQAACRAARLVEERLGDPVRAFHAYLHAFQLAPEDTELGEHLWRLARSIGEYGDDGAPARPDRDARPAPRAGARRPGGRGAVVVDSTIPIQIDDLSDVSGLHVMLDDGAGDREPGAGDGDAATPTSEEPTAAEHGEVASPPQPLAPEHGEVASSPQPLAAEGGELASSPQPLAAEGGEVAAPAQPTATGGGELAAQPTAAGRLDASALADAAAAATPDAGAPQHTIQLDVADLRSVAVPVPAAGAATPDAGASQHTIQLDVADLRSVAVPVPATGAARSDGGASQHTIQLDVADLRSLAVPVSPAGATSPDAGTSQHTIQLDVHELRSLAVPVPASPSSRRPPAPPPPPRPPAPGRPVAPRAAGTAPFRSAWEELAWAIEHLPATEPGARLRNLYRAAEVWERGAADLGRAFETLARALAAVPTDREPRERLYRLAAEHDAWDRLGDLFAAAADRAGNAAGAEGYLHEVANIHRMQGRHAEAEEIYRRILGMHPDDALARERLDAIYRLDERWADLAASLEERTDPRLGSPVPEAERPPLLRELARIYDEHLGQPYEAIASLERLLVTTPDDPDLLEQLAAIYARLGRWARVVEALARVVEQGEGTARAREARRRMARIYDEEMELPERAIEAYEGLVAVWPEDGEAHAALDRLLEQAARWGDLAEVLQRRAALATEPAARAALLARRGAVLLERLGRADEAVACLRGAREERPDDGDVTERLVSALLAIGSSREAAALLEERAEALREAAVPPGELAETLLRLALVRAEGLGDRAGARRALEEVLAAVPDHGAALAALSRLARDADARAYAEARLREAQADPDDTSRIAALLDAAITLRDRVEDPDAAWDAFRRVLEVDPSHAEATWALAALATAQGALDEARRLLERRLDDAADDDERVRALTELARLAERAGEREEAARRLDEALALRPDHAPAVLARADLYREAEASAQLEAFLRDAVPRLGAAPAEVRAELLRRLADALERQGRDDEAYQQLIDADKLQRNELATKLALGENRFRARRWREAALHLGALVEHPDAVTRPREVAEAMCHAALAETRSLRPDRAPALYEAALRLDPDHAAALHALAELEMERGNVARAADLLERQAAVATDAAERLRLFEALGDLAIVALNDPRRARACYGAAVEAASPLEPRHVPLLEKLLEQQRAAGNLAEVARTCEQLAALAPEPAARAARLVAAAEAYLGAGDAVAARAAAARAVEAAPADEDILLLATSLDRDAGDHEAIASRLGRALGGLPPPGELQAPRRAELWRRLGDARRLRGDVRNAVTAYERAVVVAPDADSGIASRRAIVELLGDDLKAAETVRAHLRALVVAEQRPAEVLALARSLATQTAAGPIDEDGARATLELAHALGEALSVEDMKFLYAHPARVMASDQVYAGVLDEDDHAALFTDPADAPLGEILGALHEAAPLLYPDANRAREERGLVAAQRVSPVDQHAALAVYAQVAKVLGAQAVVLYADPAPAAPPVSVVCAAPPLVVFGPRALATTSASSSTIDPVSDAELRFLLGRAALLTRPSRVAAAGLADVDFARLCAGLARAFGGPAPALDAPVPPHEIDAEAERLRQKLPLKVRLRIEPLIRGATATQLDPARYRAACARAADQAGLLVSGHVTIALRHAGGPARARHLVRVAVTERYLAVRAKIGIGVR